MCFETMDRYMQAVETAENYRKLLISICIVLIHPLASDCIIAESIEFLFLFIIVLLMSNELKLTEYDKVKENTTNALNYKNRARRNLLEMSKVSFAL